MQYSSSGVREQTAELSSSFLSESEIGRQFSPERNGLDTSIGPPRKHDTIEETPEGPSPPDSSVEASSSSALTEALRNRSRRRSTVGSKSGADKHTLSVLPDVMVSDADETDATESSPLLPREHLTSYHKPRHESEPDVEEQAKYKPGTWNRLGHHYPDFRHARKKVSRAIRDPRFLLRKVIVEPVFMLPAVFLGVLLNLLDALSYVYRWVEPFS